MDWVRTIFLRLIRQLVIVTSQNVYKRLIRVFFMSPGVLAGGRIASREDDLGGFVVRSSSAEPGQVSFERIHWCYPLICSDVLVRLLTMLLAMWHVSHGLVYK